MQQSAFHCWSNKTWMGPISSIVRGRSSKSDSTTRTATTGSVTNCSVSWTASTATNWDLTCSYAISAGTGPSTVCSLYPMRPQTTRWPLVGTLVTQEMDSGFTMGWCSLHMTVTTTGQLTGTVQCTTAVDSGIGTAAISASTLFAVAEITFVGIHFRLDLSYFYHRACGWCANSKSRIKQSLLPEPAATCRCTEHEQPHI